MISCVLQTSSTVRDVRPVWIHENVLFEFTFKKQILRDREREKGVGGGGGGQREREREKGMPEKV